MKVGRYVLGITHVSASTIPVTAYVTATPDEDGDAVDANIEGYQEGGEYIGEGPDGYRYICEASPNAPTLTLGTNVTTGTVSGFSGTVQQVIQSMTPGDVYSAQVEFQIYYFGDPRYCGPDHLATSYFNITAGVRLSAAVFSGLSSGRCAWTPTCTGTCSTPYTTNTVNGQCYTTGPYRQCLDFVVNGECVVYRVICFGQTTPGVCD